MTFSKSELESESESACVKSQKTDGMDQRQSFSLILEKHSCLFNSCARANATKTHSHGGMQIYERLVKLKRFVDVDGCYTPWMDEGNAGGSHSRLKH